MTQVADLRSAPTTDHLRDALADVLGGAGPTPWVRDEISASWARSAASGLVPDRLETPFDGDLDSDGLLVRAARPVMDQLAIDLAQAPVAVLLTNDQGHVVDRRVADPHLRGRLDAISLAPGFVYGEERIGTNGIGTALAQRKPTAVAGGEHFADALTTMACAGVPITDPRCGRVLGVIDLTSLAADSSGLMLPFATRAAREIEQRLVDASGFSERMLLQRFLHERRIAKGPLVLITPRAMITNAAAEGLVKAEDEMVLQEWATRPLPTTGEPITHITLGGGAIVAVRAEPLIDGGSRVGALLRLDPVAGAGGGARQRRADRPTFGWESLTSTERRIVDLVAQGQTNRQAAERLFLSHHTVGFHLRSIFAKLGVNSRVEVTRLAVERGASFGT